jgi:hypothetical protein
VFCLSARNSEKRIGKRVGSVQPNFSSIWHTGLSGAPGWFPVKVLLSGIDGGVRLKITGLSGEPTVASANGRPRNLRAARGMLQRSAGALDYPVCTGLCSVRQSAQRSNGWICQIWKEIAHQIVYWTCPVVHRTVRCATRQKARIAFHVDLQRLLAALGL